MINSINFYSSNSLYGQGSSYSYVPASSGGSYLDALFNIGMQMLLIAIAKQQLQALGTNSSGPMIEEDTDDDARLSSEKNGTQSVKHESSCHCDCPRQEPKNQDEDEHDSEPDEIQIMQDLIQQLQQQTAYQASMQRSDQFNNYLATSFSDRQIIRSIQLDGGRVLGRYDDYFLAEDYHGNRYSVSRNPSSSFNK